MDNERYYERITDSDNPLPPGGLEDDVVRLLAARKLLVRKVYWYRQSVLRNAAAILVLLASFCAGWLVRGVGNNEVTAQAASPVQQRYVMLLYNPQGFAENENMKTEYGNWFRQNSERGLEYGEELAPQGWVIDNTGNAEERAARPEDGRLSGLFFVSATSENEAMKVAKTCPHLDHKGNIELRAVN